MLQTGVLSRRPGVAARAHFHAHARGLLAMQEYAEAADDDEMMAFVVKGYEKARDLLTNQILETGLRVVKTPGASLIGFFPDVGEQPHGRKGRDVSSVGHDCHRLAIE